MSYQPLTVGDALNRGWAAFQSRIKDFLIVGVALGLVFGIIAAIVVVVWLGAAETTTFEIDPDTGELTGGGGGFFAGFLGSIIVLGFIYFVGAIIAAVINTRIALAAIDGESQYEFGDLARQGMKKFWPFLGWGMLAYLIIMVGMILCVLPGIAAAFFLAFVPFIVMDRDRLPSTNPISGSFNAVKDQAGNLIVVFLVILGIGIGVWIVDIILGLIPFVGQVLVLIVNLLFAAFALCTYATVYRASPLGGAVGGSGVAGSAIPPYQGGMPQQGYPPQAPPQQGYQQAPPQPGGYAPQPPPAAPPQTGGYPQQAPQPQAPPPQPPPQQAPQPPPQQQAPPAPPPGHQPPPPPQAPPPPPPPQ